MEPLKTSVFSGWINLITSYWKSSTLNSIIKSSGFSDTQDQPRCMKLSTVGTIAKVHTSATTNRWQHKTPCRSRAAKGLLLCWLQDFSFSPKELHRTETWGQGLAEVMRAESSTLWVHAIHYPRGHCSGYQASAATARLFVSEKSQGIPCFTYSNLHRYLNSRI